MFARPWRLFGLTSVEGERWTQQKAGLKDWLGVQWGQGGQAEIWDFSGQAIRGAELGSDVGQAPGVLVLSL